MSRITLFFTTICMTFLSFLLIPSSSQAQPMKVNYSPANSAGVLESNAITATVPYYLAIVGEERSTTASALITHMDVRGVIVNSFQYTSNSLIPQIGFNTVAYNNEVVYAAGQDRQMLVAATDRNTGSVLWSRQYGGHYIQSLVFTESAGIPVLVALGYIPNGPQDHDLAILMIHPDDGHLMHAQQIGHNLNGVNVEDQPAEIIALNDGFAIAATVDQSQMFVAKLDDQLNLQWDRLYQSNAALEVKGIAAGADHDYYTVVADTQVGGAQAGFVLQVDRNGNLINQSTFTVNRQGQSHPTSVESIAADPAANQDFYLISGSYQGNGNTQNPFIMRIRTSISSTPFAPIWVNDYSTASLIGDEIINDLLVIDGNSPFFFGVGDIAQNTGAREMLLVRPRLDSGITSREPNMCYQKMNANFRETPANQNTAVYSRPYHLDTDHPLNVARLNWTADYCTSFCGRDVFESNDSQSAAVALPSAGVNENALICSAGDEDWYYFNKTSARRIRVLLTSFPKDYDIELVDPLGNTHSSTTSTTSSGSLVRTITVSNTPSPPPTGRYYIRVFGINAVSASDWHPFDGYSLQATY